MRTCTHCGGKLNKKFGNVSLQHEGIDVFIAGVTYYVCVNDDSHAILPEYIMEDMKKSVAFKKEKAPQSEPILYIHAEFVSEEATASAV